MYTHLYARSGQCLTTCGIGVASDNDRGHEPRATNDSRAKRGAQLGIEDDAPRCDTRCGRVTHRELRIVGEDTANTDGNRVDTSSHMVHLAPRVGTCQPPLP